MWLHKEAHTISWSSYITGRNTASPQETWKHQEHAPTQECQGNQTISRISWVLPQVCSKIFGSFETPHQANPEGCFIWMDQGMPSSIPNAQGCSVWTSHTTVSGSSKTLCAFHRCKQACLGRSTHPTIWWDWWVNPITHWEEGYKDYQSPHHLCEWFVLR